MISRALEEIKRRISLLVAKDLVEAVDDSGDLQKMDVIGLAEERRKSVPRIQEFGFSSLPTPGAVAIALRLEGARSTSVIVATDDPRYRPKNLQPGEAMIYNAFGDYVKLKASGEIEIKASSKVLVTAPQVELTGNLKVDGNIDVEQNATIKGAAAVTGAVTGATVSDATGTMGSVRSNYNPHTHPVTDAPGTTGTPTPEM